MDVNVTLISSRVLPCLHVNKKTSITCQLSRMFYKSTERLLIDVHFLAYLTCQQKDVQ